ncbi:hypothetical protein POM88_052567 [Heracleum sosnowskyi]|uniref:Uncharacterized protein n=1 Tax=Heracleum sosnowskyi TaxID=360622 RepID=A0AAD8LYV3_9APIA|nr:hypothetical protein POM88_052567 [Heracleum sosnowskyi]
MKEGTYNHLNLDNFTSFRSDFVSNVKKRRIVESSNKENKSPSPFGMFRSYNQSTVINNSITPSSTHHSKLDLNNSNSMSEFRESTSYRVDDNIYCTPLMADTNERIQFSDLTNKVICESVNSRSGILQKATVVVDKQPSHRRSKNLVLANQTGVKIDTSEQRKYMKRNVVVDSETSKRPCLKVSSNPRKRNPATKSNRSIDPVVIEGSSSRLFQEVLDDNDYENNEHSSVPGFMDEVTDLFWDDDEIFTDENDLLDNEDTDQQKAVPKGYATLGPPTSCCSKCHAIMWKEERVNKNVKHGVAKFSMSCAQGRIKLPENPPTPPYLMQLKKKRQRITMKDFYLYKFQVRPNKGMIARLGGRLFQ